MIPWSGRPEEEGGWLGMCSYSFYKQIVDNDYFTP